MPLIFDGNGLVTIPTATATGDFSVTLTMTITDPINAEIAMGYNTNGEHFIASFNGAEVTARVANTTFSPRYTAGSVDDVITIEVSRVGSSITMKVDTVTIATASTSSDFILDRFGTYNSGAFPYEGILSGVCTMVGFSGAGTRTYNFDTSSGTTLTDTTSAENGTLSGFTTGGFDNTETIAITSVVDRQCKKRDGSNQASFTIAGTTSTTDAVEYRLDATGSWVTLDASPDGTNFTGSVTITDQQDLEVRISTATAVIDSVDKLTAALCICFWGQSNEAGRGLTNNTITVGSGNPEPIKWTSGGGFLEANDVTGVDGAAAGSLASRIAQMYSDYGVPVCVANVAQGGTSITEWQSGGTYYPRITAFSTATGGISFTTSVIGETDSSNAMSTATMESNLNTLLSSLDTDFSTEHYLTYFPVGTATGTTTNVNNIRAAFDNVISSNALCHDGGDLSTIDISSATNALNDNLHLKLDADQDTAAEIRFSYLYGSVADLTITGIPDGSYTTVLDDTDGVRVTRESLTYSSEDASTQLLVPPGTRLKGYVDDAATPSTNGAYIEVVTT